MSIDEVRRRLRAIMPEGTRVRIEFRRWIGDDRLDNGLVGNQRWEIDIVLPTRQWSHTVGSGRTLRAAMEAAIPGAKSYERGEAYRRRRAVREAAIKVA